MFLPSVVTVIFPVLTNYTTRLVKPVCLNASWHYKFIHPHDSAECWQRAKYHTGLMQNKPFIILGTIGNAGQHLNLFWLLVKASYFLPFFKKKKSYFWESPSVWRHNVSMCLFNAGGGLPGGVQHFSRGPVRQSHCTTQWGSHHENHAHR